MWEMVFGMFFSDLSIEVVGIVEDFFDVCEKIKVFNFDVMMFDINMLKMDGIEFFKKVMWLCFMFVIMFLMLI